MPLVARREIRWAVAFLLAASSSLADGADRRSPSLHGIYGADDRLDLHEVTNELHRAWASSVCALVDAGDVAPIASGAGYQLRTEENRIQGYAFCPGVRFADQPRAASCTGFLVAPDLVATAGHCVEDECALAGLRFVFGFATSNSGIPSTRLAVEQVYRGVELVGRRLQEGVDYAVVRLDRAVSAPGARALPVRRSGKIGDQTVVGIIGHPIGLPLKVAFGEATRVSNNAQADVFQARLDSFGGNSGSPVFDAGTGVVEGILARGLEPSFRLSSGCVVPVVFEATDPGSDVVRSTSVPWEALLGAGIPANDEMARAAPLAGASVTVVGTTVRASREAGEPDHGGRGGKSVWWSWNAPSDGSVTVTTAGSEIDTLLAVYVGNGVNSLRAVPGVTGGGEAASRSFSFVATAGSRYLIAVDGVCGQAGSVRLNLVQVPTDGQSFVNAAPIEIVNNGSARTYPSAILVRGIAGVIGRITVTLAGLDHGSVVHTDVLLVGPNGRKVMLMAGAGGFAAHLGVALTFDDAAAVAIPRWTPGTPDVAIPSGRYRPGDYSAIESFPAPAPPRPYQLRLDAFHGISPNGTWSLYIRDRFRTGTSGWLRAGWSIAITPVPNTPPVIGHIPPLTVASPDQMPSVPFAFGDAETPVDRCEFEFLSSNPALIDPSKILVNGTGYRRSLVILPASGEAGSVDVTLRVLDGGGMSGERTFRTTFLAPGARPFMDTSPILISNNLPATPFPSVIRTFDNPGVVGHVAVDLVGLTHDSIEQTTFLLAGPLGQKVVLMSGAGGPGGVSDLNLTFDDLAPLDLSASGTLDSSGAFRPLDALPSYSPPLPAPRRPYSSRLAAFRGSVPNGAWSLYGVDRLAAGGGGRLAGGWRLRLVTYDPQAAPILDHRVDRPSGTIVLAWNSVPGFAYRIESATSLVGRDWRVVGAMTARGVAESYSVVFGPLHRFYRVVRVEPSAL